MTETSARTLMPIAAEEFGSRVHAVSADGWNAPTPCTEWSVRDLANHLVSEHLWAPHLLGGATIAEVGDRYDGDVLGGDPAGAWDAAIGPSLAAWAEVSDDALVQLSFGTAPVREYAEQMLSDLAIHSWDLARGAGVSDRLDQDLVAHVWSYAQQNVPLWQDIGIFAPPVEVDTDDPQDRLIALVGRQP
jgi:uncharacterized protein (TIGR03086 family)